MNPPEQPRISGSPANGHAVPSELARQQLQRILASRAFFSSERHRHFLQFTVETALNGEADPPKEYHLGVEVFSRPDDFDPRIDTVVRVEAHRLRARLKKYYETEGQSDDLIVEFPAGGYVPSFRRNGGTHPALPAEATESPVGPSNFLSRHRRIAASVVAVGLVSLVALLFVNRRQAPKVTPEIRFSLLTGLTGDQRLAPLNHYPIIAISADGRAVAYAVKEGSGQRLHLRRLDEFAGRPLAGTEGASQPFFSPDGKWVGFFAQGSLKKVALAGGTPLIICKGVGHGATWNADGTIVIGGNPYAGLKVVSASGGEARSLTKIDRAAGEVAHLWPKFLPDGEHILFTAWLGGGFNQTPIVLYSIKTGQRRQVALGSAPVYAPSGHLLYARDSTLLSARFDLHQTAAGAEIPILTGVSWAGLCGVSHYAVSRDGSLVFIAASPDEGRLLYRSDTRGKVQAIFHERREYYHPRLSPDGKRLAVSVLSEGRYDIWIIDLTAGAARRLTVGPHRNVFATWSPDGQWLAFASDSDGPYSVYRQRADGSAAAERLTVAKLPQVPLSWAPDGSGLIYGEIDEKTGSDLVWLPLDGTRKARPFQMTESEEEAAQFSPDGQWVAYVSNQSGRREVYVCHFANPKVSWQVSNEGGWAPVWNPKGHEIIYKQRDGLRSVRGSLKGIPHFEPSRIVLQRTMADGVFPSLTNYDVSRDGQGIIFTASDESTRPPALNFVSNWLGIGPPSR